ncbi:MAG: hypothetical protein LBB67_01790 [Oscillospiraceae bacterium]|nr:hypothetical protein [Oscillospiraceae bacterium]
MKQKPPQSQTINSIAQLQAAFRQTMDLPAQVSNEADVREQLQRMMSALLAHRQIKTSAQLQNMLLACRLRLRTLQNKIAAVKPDSQHAPRDIAVAPLLEDVAAAADLLLAPFGRNIVFLSSENQAYVRCDPRALIWLELEMLCNAVRHTPGEEITVHLTAAQASVTLQAESGGFIDLQSLHDSLKRDDSGSAAMLRTAQLHSGSLLWSTSGTRAVCALRLPRSKAYNPRQSRADVPDFVDLLCDQLSPVYTALAPCIGC